jgi:DNA polymerase I-like protein with 3'-5' exonuclease and polymerase domains
LFGRKRYIENINDKNDIIKKSAQREAINMPIQ